MKHKIILFLFFFAIGMVVLGRLHIVFVRFFDPDEFAHLHWAWLVSQGKIPFRDFLFYLTPVYQWLLTPLFLFPAHENILIAARLFEYGLYLLTALLILRITNKITRTPYTGIIAMLIYLTFPLTLDKTVDTRPDILMILLYLLAIDLIVSSSHLTKKRLIFIGILLGLSFMTLYKIAFAVPATGLLIVLKLKHISIQKILDCAIGFLVPLLVCTLIFLYQGILSDAWNAFTRVSFIVNAGKLPFPLSETLSPWPLVYVSQGGISLPWSVNTAVWIASLIGVPLLWLENKTLGLFVLVFFAGAFILLVLFPAPYVQYFMPISVFASILTAVAISRIIKKIKNGRVSLIFITGITVILLLSFGLQYQDRVSPASSNGEQMHVIADVLKISKPTDTFYDMVGSYVFRPDGYYICCHPYAEFVDKLNMNIPTLRDSLIANHTNYVVMDRTGQVFWKPKPEDLTFLTQHYRESPYKKIYIWRN